MTEHQNLVREFNIAIETDRGETPALRANELRARLIEEEARETIEAIRRGDFVEVIDGLCDVRYVVLGAADVFGIDLLTFAPVLAAPDIPGSIRTGVPELRAHERWRDRIEARSIIACGGIRGSNFPVAVAGLCALLYTTEAAASDFGIDLDPFFREVHRTNMLKLEGPIDEHGKKLKPPGWKPPQIERMLRDLLVASGK